MNNNLIVVLVVLLVIIAIVASNKLTENFQVRNNNGGTCPLSNVHPDNHLRDFVNSSNNNSPNNNRGSNHNSMDNKLNRVLNLLGNEDENAPTVDTSNYVRKTNIERAARGAAREYCPVPPDYDPSHYIKKTEIDTEVRCPKMPDLRNYVLKSTIPPATKCPPCICPKVNVSAGFCKKCPEPEEICPRPKPCNAEKCRNVIKCPTPTPPPKQKPLKCPPPQPCPGQLPCPKVERCPPNQSPKCKYYGVKTVDSKKPIDELIQALLDGNDPDKTAQLNKLRELLGMAEMDLRSKAVPTTVARNNRTSPAVVPSNSRTEVTAAPTTQAYMKPVVDYNNKCVDESLMYSAVGVLGSSYV
jgi:hypothetical protein